MTWSTFDPNEDDDLISGTAEKAVVVATKDSAFIEMVPDNVTRMKASAEFLKRRFPKRWTDRLVTEQEIHVTAEQTVELSPATRAAVEELLMRDEL